MPVRAAQTVASKKPPPVWRGLALVESPTVALHRGNLSRGLRQDLADASRARALARVSTDA
jgi:hypothetical protein